MNSIPITRHQGETYPVELNMTTAGVTLPIDGFDFELIVNEKEAPTPADPDLFASTGTVVDGPEGIVHFPISAGNANHLGRFHYRLRMADAGGFWKTVLAGHYLLLPSLQPGESFEWTPPTTPADGSAVPIFGDGYLIAGNNVQSLTYETRYHPDSKSDRRVIRTHVIPVHAFDYSSFLARGDDFPRWTHVMPGWEFVFTFYIDRGTAQIQLWEGDGGYSVVRPYIDTRDGTVVADVDGSLLDVTDGDTKDLNFILRDPLGWPVAGWYQIGVKVERDGTCYALTRPEDSASDWYNVHPSLGWPAPIDLVPTPRCGIQREFPENAASIAEFYKFEWRPTE